MTTVGELREWLSQYDDETEVRLAHQPNYPLESSVGGVCDKTELESRQNKGRRPEDGDPDEDDDDVEVVWILEGSPMGYASKRLWD